MRSSRSWSVSRSVAKSAMAGTGSLSIAARPLRIEASSYGADRSALAAGSYVEVAISDDGPGMATSKLDTIFDPRLEGVERVGTGLALAMCWSLVEQAGGTILVESRVGVGSTFRVLLPRVEYQAVPPSSEVVASFARAERCVKVLVVDDEPAIRQLVVRQLESVGHSAVEALDGEDALEKLTKAGDFDLVVSDVLMPAMGAPNSCAVWPSSSAERRCCFCPATHRTSRFHHRTANGRCWPSRSRETGYWKRSLD